MSLVDVRLDCLASPARARSLLTVRAAISSALSSLLPRFFSPSLMCSYCRSRLEFHACWGIATSSSRSLPETPTQRPVSLDQEVLGPALAGGSGIRTERDGSADSRHSWSS